MSVKRGSKTGLITDSQESSTTPQHRANPDENHGVRVLLMMLMVTLMDVPMGEEGRESLRISQGIQENSPELAIKVANFDVSSLWKTLEDDDRISTLLFLEQLQRVREG